MHKKYSYEDVKYDIINFINTYNSYSSTLYRKYGSYNQTIIDRFGGWEHMLKDIGIFSIRNSQSEVFIQNKLEENNIEYFIHYNFDWLVTSEKHKMFVDFYIPKYNLVIEYNGKQHYEFTEYFHKTKEKFAECYERDTLKYNLFNNHNIKLIIIKYDEDLLEAIDNIIKTLN